MRFFPFPYGLFSRPRVLLLAAITTAVGAGPLAAQDASAPRVEKIVMQPDSLVVAVGERVPIQVTALDASGNLVADPDMMVWMQGAEASVDQTAGIVTGVRPGETVIEARIRHWAPGRTGYEDLKAYTHVVVRYPPVEQVEIDAGSREIYAGTRERLTARASSAGGVREDASIRWSSSDPEVLEVGPAGLVYARQAGTARLTASADGASVTSEFRVVDNPIRTLVVEPTSASVRVGDVLRLTAGALDDDEHPVAGGTVHWSWEALEAQPFDALQVDADDGRTGVIVPNEPGLYRVTAQIGGVWRDVLVRAQPRPSRRKISLVSHGVVPTGQATTDLWAFEGQDGRDYVYTGTYHGNLMYAWDVSDPAAPVIVDSVEFDGRRVNDVKINDARSLAVVTSEHASDRKNGITVLDITDPSQPRKLSHYTKGLTGGVHNTWIVDDLVYAVHYGTRAVHIIDVSDPSAPAEVGRWQLPNADRFLHDVTVLDGYAYLSYWNDGVVILDIGAGTHGGTPTEPALVSQYAYSYRLGSESYANTHHAIRYGDYVFTGDEIFGCAECVNGPRGYIHVIDVSDIDHPRKVAWYRVPEAGSHNLWAEDDKLYVGYYQAGLRVVDISGELRGDLYRQGREIAWYMTEDGTGSLPNATDTWGAQPFKGKIYASDSASGLWIVEMAGQPPLVP
jgi:hypothetical protein